MTSQQPAETEHVHVTIEHVYHGRNDSGSYRVVRNWRLGVCSGYQVCGTFTQLADAERRAAHIRNGGGW